MKLTGTGVLEDLQIANLGDGLDATDMFCGGGGTSLGAEVVPGVRVRLALNHWRAAVDLHQTRFPHAGHDCADVSAADPRRYPRTRILLASPECTNQTGAKGVSRKKQNASFWDAPDPSAERSRATMWDVPRFAEVHRYDAIVTENVVEAKDWILWRAWHVAMEDLGYEHEVLSINSMHHGVPQSRDRIYVVFWRKGIRIDLTRESTAWCPRCERDSACRQAWKNNRRVGKYRQQWVWTCSTCATIVDPAVRPALDIIDGSLPCPRIGDRGVTPCPYCGRQPCGRHWKALVAATRERILDGILRHPPESAPPFAVNTAHGGRLHDLAKPHPTVCAHDDRLSLVVPLRNNGRARPAAEALTTVAAAGNHHALVMRNNKGGAEMVTPVHEPVRTITTKGHQSLLMPYYSNGRARPVGAGPVPTVSTRDRCAVIDPETIVDDCGFRMLEPHEIAAAMAFPAGYIPGDLPKKHQVRLAGNAVTPPVMTWIVGRVAEALGGAA